MYDFILLALTGLAILLGYIFASRLMTTSLINSSTIHFSRFYRSENKLSLQDLLCYVLSGLKELENVQIPRLAILVSQSWKMDKLMIKWGIVLSKISQAILLMVLFAPIEYFAIFFVAILILQFLLKDFSIRTLGVLMGMILAKSCIEFSVYIFSKYVPDSGLIVPGSYYFELIMGNLGGLFLFGVLLSFITNNFTMVLPVILLLSFVFKLSLVQCGSLIISFYAGCSLRRYFFSNFTTGFFFAYLREDSAFYFLLSLAIACGLIIGDRIDPELLSRTVEPAQLPLIPFVIFVATLAVVPIFILSDFFKIPYYRHEEKMDWKSKENLYRYPLRLFRETSVGLQVVKNELRKYASELYAYIEKSGEWINGSVVLIEDIEFLRSRLCQRSAELKRYLDLIFLGQEIKFFEKEAISCVEFLDGTNALHETLYEKLKLISSFGDLKKLDDSKPFFLNMIEAEDAVFLLYREVLQSMEEEDVKTLFKILEHKETIFQESQESYTQTYGETSSEESRKLAFELTRLYQIDLWQIHHLLELLSTPNAS